MSKKVDPQKINSISRGISYIGPLTLGLFEVGFLAFICPYVLTLCTTELVVNNHKEIQFNHMMFGFFLIATFALCFSYKLIKDIYRGNQRNEEDEEHSLVRLAHEKLRAENEQLNTKIKNAETKMDSIDTALQTLSSSLRPYVVMSHKASWNWDDNQLSFSTAIKPIEIYENLYSLCSYISQIMFAVSGCVVRCGLLLRDPHQKGTIVPLVVYHQGNENYISRRLFIEHDCFTGKLFRNFEMFRDAQNSKSHVSLVFPTREDAKNRGYEITWPNDYVQSIAGSVVYYSNPNVRDEKIVVGAINIDSNIPGVIQEEDYLSMKPYLRPVFRLMAAELVPIYKSAEFFDKLVDMRNSTRRNEL